MAQAQQTEQTELDRTRKTIEEEKEILEDLRRQPRKLRWWERLVNLIKSVIFKEQAYTREDYLGAKIVNSNDYRENKAQQAENKEANTKGEPQQTKAEHQKAAEIPDHKPALLFAGRDKRARDEVINELTETSDKATYVRFYDTGYLAKIEKMDHEIQMNTGVKAHTNAYKMTVYNEKGVEVGTIPAEGQRPLSQSELQAQLTNKGLIEPMMPSEFQKTLRDRDLSVNKIEKHVSSLMNTISNPYIGAVHYENLDISHDKKGNITFKEHVTTRRHGNMTLESDPKHPKEALEYLADALSDKLITSMEQGYKVPQVQYDINVDAISQDIKKAIESQHKEQGEQLDWSKKQNFTMMTFDDMAFHVQPSKDPKTPGEFSISVLRDDHGHQHWEDISDPAQIQEEMNKWVAKDKRNLGRLSEMRRDYAREWGYTTKIADRNTKSVNNQLKTHTADKIYQKTGYSHSQER